MLRFACLSLAVLMAACSTDRHLSVTPIPEDGAAWEVSVVPMPAEMALGDTELNVAGPLVIVAPGEAAASGHVLAGYVTAAGGPEASVVESGDGAVVLAIEPGSPAEGYTLSAGADGVRITASDAAGVFYGVQTLRQLMPVPGSGAPWSIRTAEITDAPRFSYRGLHLDVGRHFFDVAFVKKYLDRMAELKLNTFHWGLTQDQGWRAEILGYPRLQEVASCRRETILEKNFDPYVGDGVEHCGYYTQDEMRDVVAYAAERHITVVPEVNMPGHSVAAIAAYPELGCSSEPREVATYWGIFDDVLCPSEATFTFLENVLTELLDIFPSEFIHTGGDEVPKTRWEQSDLAQEIIRREGLADEHELQSWFTQRMEQFLSARGRRLIGWDEILEGGLAPGATVMSWRGTEGGIAAAKMGHDVIMTPTRHLYLDFYQGPQESEPLSADWSGYPLPLSQVYEYDPMPTELTAEEGQYILGAQGNVWTEYMPTTERVEYMVFPRAFALAEMVWTPQQRRSYEDFLARVPAQLARFDALGVGYRPLD